MGISNLFLPFFWLCITGLFANGQNGDMPDSTDMGPPPPPAAVDSITSQLKPGIVVTVGILTTIFSITFLLLLYVKHCRPGGYSYSLDEHLPAPAPATERKDPGVNRKVIQSLPIFRFSSLRGQKEGLECAVCLNKFEPEEVMKLLPKCKHAFHVECVDVWLEIHPTCPLCRYRVHPEDVLLLDGKSLYNHQPTPRGSDQGILGRAAEFGGNARVSGRHTSAGECLEIIVENPADDNNSPPARASLDSWSSRRNKTGGIKQGRRDFRCRSLDSWRARRSGDHQAGKAGEISGRRSRSLSRKDGRLPVQGDKHRVEHQIILSAGEGEEEGVRRWSDAEAADMLYLRTEMIIGGGEGESGRGVINGRSVSELTGVSRYNNRSNNGGGRREERGRRQGEGVMKRWLSSISLSTTAVNSAPSNAV